MIVFRQEINETIKKYIYSVFLIFKDMSMVIRSLLLCSHKPSGMFVIE